MAEAGAIDVRPVELEIHEMPIARGIVAGLGRISIGVAVLVRPSGLMSEVPGRELGIIAGEHRLHPLAHRWLEVVIRYQRDHLMTFIAPGKCGSGT